VLDVEAWGSLDVELKLGRSAWPRGRPGERSRSPVCPESQRRGLGIARRGAGTRPLDLAPWSTRGTRSLACLSGVLDVEAWGPLGVELKLGRSTWHVVDQGNVVASLSTRSLDVEAWGSLGVELKLGRSAWHVVDQGNVVASLSTRSLDVEAWGSLGVELKLGRSTWCRG
jgi:hypothetical protein